MGNLIVIVVISAILFLAIRPIIKYNKNKKDGEDFGCFKCSSFSKSNCSKSDCNGCK